MSLYDICVWIHNTSIGTAIRESTLMFPVIEGTHLLAMGASAGIIAFSDLRLLGWVMKKEPVSEVMGRLLPWAIGGFAVVMVTGVLLFWADAESLYRNRWFRYKVLFLFLAALNALIYHSTIHRNVFAWDRAPIPPRSARLAGLFSLALWALVIAAGRTTAYKM